MYLEGKGELLDAEKALEFCIKAADQGEKYALSNLGLHSLSYLISNSHFVIVLFICLTSWNRVFL